MQKRAFFRLFAAAAVASLVGSVLSVVAFTAPAAAAGVTFAIAGTGGGNDQSGGDVYIYDTNYNYTFNQVLTVSDTDGGMTAPYVSSSSPGTGITCSQTLPAYVTGSGVSPWPNNSASDPTSWKCLIQAAPGPANGDDSGVSGSDGTSNTVTFTENDSDGPHTDTFTIMVLPPPLTVVAPDTAAGGTGSLSGTIDQTYSTAGDPTDAVVEQGGASGPSGALITGVTPDEKIYTGTNPTDPAGSETNLTIQASPGFFWTNNYSAGSDTEYNLSESDRNTSGQTWTAGATTTSPPNSTLTEATEAYSPFTPGEDGADLDQTCPPAPAMIDAGMPFCFTLFQSSGNGPNAGAADLDFAGQAVPTTTTPTVATSASGTIGQSVNITDASGACPSTIGTGGTGLFVNSYNCWYGRAGDGTPVSVTVGGVPATTVTPNNTYTASSVAVTSGSDVVSTTSGTFPTYVIGDNVSGAGIPPGTTVIDGVLDTASWANLELSNDATATSAGEPLTFTSDVSGSYFNIGNNNGYASTISSTTLTDVGLTGGSNQVTATTPDSGTAAKPYSGLVGGMVSGTDIPSNTEVTACSGNCAGTGSGTVTLTLSNNATTAVSSETLTFYPLYLNPPQLNANVTIPAGTPTGPQTMEVCEPTTPTNGFDWEFGVEDMAPAGSLSYINGNSGPTQVCGSTTIDVQATSSTASTPTNSSISLGDSNSDGATVTGSIGGTDPTGTVSFYACGEGVDPCTPSGTPFDTETLSGSSNPDTVTSASFTPTSAGTWCFAAVYSGDGNYSGSSDQSSDECYTVGTVGSTTTSTPTSSSITVGSSNTDAATVTGDDGVNPTGAVSFYACGEGVDPCTPSGTPFDTETLSGSSNPDTVTSASFTPDSAGTWCFAAVYSGDGNYTGSNDSTSDECYTVNQATSTTISTPNNSSISLGDSNSDGATVTGSVGSIDPTGTVSFYACGENVSPCTPSGTPFDTETLSGTANPDTVTSASFTPDSAGTWCFAAVYSGDGNYSGSNDGTSDECYTVAGGVGSTTISTPNSLSISLGDSNSDGATVTGSVGDVDPTGTVSFYACGENVSPCAPSGTPFDTETLSGTANPDTVTSASFTPDSTGTWCFAAVYSGDGNYSGSTDQSTDECYTVGTVGSTTTSTPNSMTAALDGPNSDSVLITGGDGANNAPYPTGTVKFYTCGEGVDPCTSANWAQLGSTVTLGASSGNTNTATSTTFKNDSVGTWCFAAVYSGDGNYTGSNDSTSDECYTVAQTSTTTLSSPLNSTITEGQSNIDQATVYGNDADSSPPAPTGTVTFYQCGPTTSPTACAGGTEVGTPVNLTTSGSNTATASSKAFTPSASPTAIGYWCFRAVYSGDGNYFTSSDDSSTNECFYVGGPLIITTASPLPQGTDHVAYSHQLTAAGGTMPYTWSKTGALPRGITLSHSGLLSGTPTRSGTFTFTAKVKDSSTPRKEKASKSLTITIQ